MMLLKDTVQPDIAMSLLAHCILSDSSASLLYMRTKITTVCPRRAQTLGITISFTQQNSKVTGTSKIHYDVKLASKCDQCRQFSYPEV